MDAAEMVIPASIFAMQMGVRPFLLLRIFRLTAGRAMLAFAAVFTTIPRHFTLCSILGSFGSGPDFYHHPSHPAQVIVSRRIISHILRAPYLLSELLRSPALIIVGLDERFLFILLKIPVILQTFIS